MKKSIGSYAIAFLFFVTIIMSFIQFGGLLSTGFGFGIAKILGIIILLNVGLLFYGFILFKNEKRIAFNYGLADYIIPFAVFVCMYFVASRSPYSSAYSYLWVASYFLIVGVITCTYIKVAKFES